MTTRTPSADTHLLPDGVALMSSSPTTSASTRPRGRVADDTPADELERLALAERMHDDCDPLKLQATMWLTRAHAAIVAAQAEELRPLDLSPSAFNVLLALHGAPHQALEPCQLADRLTVSRPSVTGLLDTLQRKDLIARTPHDDDGRRILVTLTAAGCSLLEQHLSVHYAELEKTYADLSPDELTQLVTLLRRVRGSAYGEPGSA